MHLVVLTHYNVCYNTDRRTDGETGRIATAHVPFVCIVSHGENSTVKKWLETVASVPGSCVVSSREKSPSGVAASATGRLCIAMLICADVGHAPLVH